MCLLAQAVELLVLQKTFTDSGVEHVVSLSPDSQAPPLPVHL